MHQKDGARADGVFPDAGENEERADKSGACETAEPEADQPRQRPTRLLSKEDEAKLKTPPPRPDAWLERRLRVFERTVETIETQQKEVRADHRAALVRMDETIAELKKSIAALQAENATLLPDLQANVKNMRFRLDVVEAVASAALESATAPAVSDKPEKEAPSENEAAPVFVPDEKEAEPEVQASAEEASSEPAPREASYLEHARQKANAAAAEAAESALARKLERARNLARYNKRLLTGIAIGVLVFAVSAGLSFHRGYLDGRAHAAENHSIKHKTIRKAAQFAPPRKLQLLAQAGNRDAQLLLALRYYPPKGEPLDAAAARRWMMRAAQAGQPMAQYLFAKFEERGVAAPINMAGAIRWYESAAWSGNRKAMNDLAVIFAQGTGVAANPEEAALWFYRAADHGSRDAQFNLAILYERGLGVPQSAIHAYKWYSIAAAGGDLASKQRLAVLDGQIGEEDLRVAESLVARFSPKTPEASANLLPDEARLVNGNQIAAR